MNNPVSIREAREDDLPAMLEIYNQVILHTTAVYEYKPHTLDMRREWWSARKRQGFPVLVAVSGESIAGFSSLGPFRGSAAYLHSVENSVYVTEKERGRGLGKLLLQPLIGWAAGNGYHAMLAGIDAGNESSLRLHRHFGFAEVAHFREVGWKFDRWLDLKFLQLILSTSKPPATPNGSPGSI